ncbi:MAG: TauD/TfdA family dioxygenase [Sciscionella sp.]
MSIEMSSVLAGVGFVPERVPAGEPEHARETLARDGAVIMSGWPVEPESLVCAAAAVLGTRLRELEAVTDRASDADEGLPFHTDGANLVIDVHDRPVRLRDPDIDYLLLLCATPAPSGGESLVADAYRLVAQIHDQNPDLYEFLTQADVAFESLDRRDVQHTPSVCRMVEWTRGGRIVIRAAAWAQPRPREPQREEHQRHLASYAQLLAGLAARMPGDRLQSGEILVIDNYRCLHAVHAHQGPRRIHTLRCKSADAV